MISICQGGKIMSRVIDMDKISEVLLADGWHTVTQINNKSTFCLEPHEYIRDRAPAAEGLQFTGATWLEEKDDAQFYCPLTAILAVKIKGQGAGITSVQQRKDRQGFWRRFHSISKSAHSILFWRMKQREFMTPSSLSPNLRLWMFVGITHVPSC
jgi:hypothetical protein